MQSSVSVKQQIGARAQTWLCTFLHRMGQQIYSSLLMRQKTPWGWIFTASILIILTSSSHLYSREQSTILSKYSTWMRLVRILRQSSTTVSSTLLDVDSTPAAIRQSRTFSDKFRRKRGTRFRKADRNIHPYTQNHQGATTQLTKGWHIHLAVVHLRVQIFMFRSWHKLSTELWAASLEFCMGHLEKHVQALSRETNICSAYKYLKSIHA